MGGLETTAHTLSFTLYCIAANPIVQQNIVQELLAHNLLQSAKHEPLDLTFDRLAQLLYIDAVLKEAMRMFSVVAGFPRCVSILWSIYTYLSFVRWPCRACSIVAMTNSPVMDYIIMGD